MTRPLVGQRCRLVARPEVEGRVIDVAPLGRLLHVELDSERGWPDWVTFDEVEPIPASAVETEDQGHDAHLDAIERDLNGGAR